MRVNGMVIQMGEELYIISMPDGNEESMISAMKTIMKETKTNKSIYLTKAKIQGVEKKDILDWLEVLVHIANDQGWTGEVVNRMKKYE